MAASAWRKFTAVPDTWEAWAQRVMTICMALLLVGGWLLFGAIHDVQQFISDSRTSRLNFQVEETARQCAILRGQGLDDDTLRALRC